MSVEMSKTSSVRFPPGQEIKLAKPATELYVGQILKTVVVTTLSNDQVLININGQNLNAKASHHFTPGELFEVKVLANHPETILEVQQKHRFHLYCKMRYFSIYQNKHQLPIFYRR